MNKPTDQGPHAGRPKGGRSRSQSLREARVSYRTGLKAEGKVVVSVPISEEANLLLKESAESVGKTATALMTQLLEEAANQWSPSNPPAILNGNFRSAEREQLHKRFAAKLVINPLLTRKMVSFQASKATAFYRWLKYKEAF